MDCHLNRHAFRDTMHAVSRTLWGFPALYCCFHRRAGFIKGRWPVCLSSRSGSFPLFSVLCRALHHIQLDVYASQPTLTFFSVVLLASLRFLRAFLQHGHDPRPPIHLVLPSRYDLCRKGAANVSDKTIFSTLSGSFPNVVNTSEKPLPRVSSVKQLERRIIKLWKFATRSSRKQSRNSFLPQDFIAITSRRRTQLYGC